MISGLGIMMLNWACFTTQDPFENSNKIQIFVFENL